MASQLLQQLGKSICTVCLAPECENPDGSTHKPVYNTEGLQYCEDCDEILCAKCWHNEHQNLKRRSHVPQPLPGSQRPPPPAAAPIQPLAAPAGDAAQSTPTDAPYSPADTVPAAEVLRQSGVRDAESRVSTNATDAEAQFLNELEEAEAAAEVPPPGGDSVDKSQESTGLFGTYTASTTNVMDSGPEGRARPGFGMCPQLRQASREASAPLSEGLPPGNPPLEDELPPAGGSSSAVVTAAEPNTPPPPPTIVLPDGNRPQTIQSIERRSVSDATSEPPHQLSRSGGRELMPPELLTPGEQKVQKVKRSSSPALAVPGTPGSPAEGRLSKGRMPPSQRWDSRRSSFRNDDDDGEGSPRFQDVSMRRGESVVVREKLQRVSAIASRLEQSITEQERQSRSPSPSHRGGPVRTSVRYSRQDSPGGRDLSPGPSAARHLGGIQTTGSLRLPSAEQLPTVRSVNGPSFRDPRKEPVTPCTPWSPLAVDTVGPSTPQVSTVHVRQSASAEQRAPPRQMSGGSGLPREMSGASGLPRQMSGGSGGVAVASATPQSCEVAPLAAPAATSNSATGDPPSTLSPATTMDSQ